MKTLTTLALVSLCYAGKLSAGHLVGNGGYTIRCPDEFSKNKLQILDYYDALTSNQQALRLATADSSLSDRLAATLTPLRRLDQARWQRYQNWITDFWRKLRFVNVANLPPASDRGGIIYPPNCELQQIAFQQRGARGDILQYLVDIDLWRQLDADNQASLILHEIIFREATWRGHDDATHIRAFVQVLLRDLLSQASHADYEDWILRNGFKEFRWHTKHAGKTLYFRLFLDFALTHDQAKVFCQKLSSRTSLVNWQRDYTTIMMEDNAIRDILNTHEQWLWSGEEMPIARLLPGGHTKHSMPDDIGLGFACSQPQTEYSSIGRFNKR